MAAILTFLIRLFGIYYLPSPDPVISVWWFWVFGGLFSFPLAIGGAAAFLSGISKAPIRSFFVSLFVLASLPVIFGAALNITLGATLPMLHTAVSGQAGQIDYDLQDSYASKTRLLCRGGVRVKTGVYGHSILCGMPLEKNHGLRLERDGMPENGATITVYGKTSVTGVFYTSFEVTPNP